MSNFRRVSDTTNLPNFIEKKFIGAQVEIEEDPYAEIKKNSAENRVKISKQQIGITKSASNSKSWEKVEQALTFNQFAEETLEDRLASGNFNRVENNTRTASNLQAFSPDDYMNVLMNHSSEIFNPEMFGISQEFMNSQDRESQQAIVDSAHRREAKAAKHSAWEREAMDSLRKSQVVNSRAHSILRVSSDVESRSSQFGVLDPSELDERENMRVANQNRAREQKLAIKKKQQEDLVNKSLNHSKTLADIYNSFNIDED
jgi:hypothetical protein